MKKPTRRNRDIEVTYTNKQFVEKLRRLADCIERGQRFTIQLGGQRITVPQSAVMNIEHECEGRSEEIEFQIKWQND